MNRILRKNSYLLPELTIIMAVLIATIIFNHANQPHIHVNNGRGFDGVFYYQAAEQIASGEPIRTEAPFVYRLGTLWLVGRLFPNTLLEGFFYINLFGSILAIFLMVVWLRMFLNAWYIRAFLVTLFITQWLGPLRFTFFDPTFTDPWLFVFLISGLILLRLIQTDKSRLVIILFGMVCFTGILFREMVLILPLACLWVYNPVPPLRELMDTFRWEAFWQWLKRYRYISLLPLMMTLPGFYLVRNIATQSNEYSFFQTAFNWLYDKPFLTYLHAYFITFGPLIIVPFFAWGQIRRFLSNHQWMILYLLGFIVIGWIGGSDTERFLYWAVPVVSVLIGFTLQENKPVFRSWLLFIFIAGGIVASQRLFWAIPNYPSPYQSPLPILSILTSRAQYLDLWSYFSARTLQAISLGQYIIYCGVLLLWLNLRAHRLRIHQ